MPLLYPLLDFIHIAHFYPYCSFLSIYHGPIFLPGPESSKARPFGRVGAVVRESLHDHVYSISILTSKSNVSVGVLQPETPRDGQARFAVQRLLAVVPRLLRHCIHRVFLACNLPYSLTPLFSIIFCSDDPTYIG